MSCGVGHRYGSDLMLLWLWRRQATTALIRPLAWELPYDVGAALKSKKKKKKKKDFSSMFPFDLSFVEFLSKPYSFSSLNIFLIV